MAGDPQPHLYVHIGLQKTGTSYLQQILWASVDELRSQGIELVPDSKLDAFHLALDVRDRFDPDIDPPRVTQALDRFTQALARTSATALVSQESLSTATTEQIARFVAGASGREVHVILTLRDLGRQIPAAWQQTIQRGGTLPLRRFVRRLQRSADRTSRGWAPMDVPRTLDRWLTQVPPERIHVVTVPPLGSAPRLLLERFCSVIGVDDTRLTVDEGGRANRGLRYEHAEVLRRINAELPPEFKRRDLYGDIGKRYLALNVLGDAEGSPIRLATDDFEWCAEVAEEFIAHVSASGCPVVGDLADLRPAESSFIARAERPAASDVLDVATRALTTVVADQFRARLGEADPPAQAADPGWRERLRRITGR